MVDILLIQPPIRDFYLTSKRTIPYGLIQVAAALKQAGFSVDILDGLATPRSRPIPLPPELSYLRQYYPSEDRSPFSLFYRFRHFGYSYEHLARLAKASGAHLIGISALFTPYANSALQLAEAIKTLCPSGRIVVGGHHASVMPEHLMASAAVDYVLRGDGEICLPRLAEALRDQSGLEAVPGLVYRKPDGSLQKRPPAYIDAPAQPAGNGFSHKFYRRNKRSSAVIVSSRGCPFNCSYCSMARSTGIPYRRRRVDSVMAEIDDYVRLARVGFIDFEDENLAFNKPWVLELMTQIKTRFGQANLELRAMNGLYPPSLDRKVVVAMAEAGFKTLNLSIGSTSPAQQQRFKRPDVRKAFDSALKWAQLSDLSVVGYIIAGAPNQRPMDSIEDLLFLAQRPALIGLSVYYPAPASSDYSLCQQLGLLPEHLTLMRSSALPIEHTTSRLEVATLMRLARIVNFIKYLIGHGIPLPSPKRPPLEANLVGKNRLEIGRTLLGGFFSDGKIRGVNPDGQVYDQPVSEPLARLFLEKIAGIDIKGCH